MDKRGRISVKQLQKGFTLIELMIVIAIIAILAAILIPNFLHARAESQTAACEGNEKQIATALEEYAVDNSGTYPAFGAVTQPGFMPLVYMANSPTDPVGGAPYTTQAPVAPCSALGAVSYEIIDAGGHDATVKIANAGIGATSVVYCSGSGINGK
jgi:prepilin-type N-terminal cleavage/methylation domain-containing protein